VSLSFRVTLADIVLAAAAANHAARVREQAIAEMRSMGVAEFLDVPAGFSFDVAPEAAMGYFRAKGLRPSFSYADMVGAAHDQAVTVAKMMDMDMLGQMRSSLDEALAGGTSFGDWKKQVVPMLQKGGWWGEKDVVDPATGQTVRAKLGSPWRLECLTGDNLVSGAVIRAAHRRWYEGRVVEVVTASGRKFTATPNHPMLTRRGWIGAGDLCEGDDLIGYAWQQGAVPAGDDHVAEPPATIEEVFDTLAARRDGSPERVRGSVLDFHGDGRDRDVDVVRTDRDLRLGRFSAVRKPLEDLLFTDAPKPGARFCASCGHLMVITKRCGFCDRPYRGAGLLQALKNGAMAAAEVVSQGVRAFALGVATGNLSRGDVIAQHRGLAATLEMQATGRASIARYPSCADEGADKARGDADAICNREDAQSGDIEFDRVATIRVRHFVGHVFNLSTQHGYYGLNGLYTGNTIFRTNMQQAYAVEAWAAVVEQAELAPFLMYDAIDDLRTRAEHRRWDRTVLRWDDPWFKTHFPPLGFNCRCGIVQLSQDELSAMGMSVAKDAPEDGTYRWRNPRTDMLHTVPNGVDPGFDRNPGDAYVTQLERLAREKIMQIADPKTAAAAEKGLASVARKTPVAQAAAALADLADDVARAGRLDKFLSSGLVGYVAAMLAGEAATAEQVAAFAALSRTDQRDVEAVIEELKRG
jgi:SPP1 gp7 family putative phage head morphogenesis protein